MFTEAEKIRAIGLYFKYGRKLAPVLRIPGYLTLTTAAVWYLPAGRLGIPAAMYWLAVLMNFTLTGGVFLSAPSIRMHPLSQKHRAVIDLCTRRVSVREISENIGVSRTVLYKWKDEIIGDEAYQNMCKHRDLPPAEERDALREEVARLNQEIRRQQMELDILKKTEEIIKKDPGISASALTNREKTLVANTHRNTYSLAELFRSLHLSHSSYFYHRAALRAEDKYAAVCIVITDIFNSNYRCYGYRRLHAMLRHEGLQPSEKVVRRLMAEEQLVVSRNCRRRYSSYCGEIGPAPDNFLARDFKAEQPNQKWLTDITEFQLPTGKVWLSPVVDCSDGKVVSWALCTRPDAELANIMLESAIRTLKVDDRPVIHSDRGGHYRWPGWLERVNATGLIRSMSRKGCSPDNAACGGGRVVKK